MREKKPSSTARGYDRAWRKVRAAHLDEHPVCEDCGRAGTVESPIEVDHLVAFDGIADPLRLDPRNLRSRCHPCHDAKTKSATGESGVSFRGSVDPRIGVARAYAPGVKSRISAGPPPPVLSDLYATLAPPTPPLFSEPLDWPALTGDPDGATCWQRMVDALDDRARDAPVVHPRQWRALLHAEIERRARRAFALDYGPDGKLRPLEERGLLRAADLRMCRGSMWYWLLEHATVGDPKAVRFKTLEWVPWPVQTLLICWLELALREAQETEDDAYRILSKGRKMGATWCLVLWLVWRLLFVEDSSALVGSITMPELDNGTQSSLLGKVRWAIDQQPAYLRPGYPGGIVGDIREPQRIIEHTGTGARILGGVMSPTFGVSNRVEILARDEAAKTSAAIQTALKSATTSVAALLLELSTQDGKDKEFWFDWKEAATAQKLELRWPVVPTRDDKWRRSQEKGHGGRLTIDQALQEYDCSPSGVSGERVWHPPDADLVIFDELPAGGAKWPRYAAIHLADGPAASVAIAVRADWTDPGKHSRWGELPRLWVDEVAAYQRQPAEAIGQDLARRLTGLDAEAWSDPESQAIEDEHRRRLLETWGRDLRRAGLPVRALPPPYLERHFLAQGLLLVDSLLVAGRIRIADGAARLYEAIEQWQWDLPAGVRVDQVSRDSIRWRRDGWSRYCLALLYVTTAVVQFHQPRRTPRVPVAAPPPTTVGGELAGLWG